MPFTGDYNGIYSGLSKTYPVGLRRGDSLGLARENSYPWDADAWTYIQYIENKTAIPLSKNVINAIHLFVIRCKACGAWDQADIIYPFIGGTAASHSVNMKNPGGSTEITWHGTVTHDYLGPHGDGSTGYGDTHYLIDGASTKKYQRNSGSIAVYITARNGEAYAGAPLTMGALTIFTTDIAAMRHQNALQTEPFINSNSSALVSGYSNNGFSFGNRTLAGIFNIYANGNGPIATGGISTVPVGFSCYVLSANFGGSTPYSFTKLSMGFAYLGGGNVNAVEFNTAVEALQLALGRSVF